MRRGCSNFYKNASDMMRGGDLARAGSAIAVGLLLSGCVATTLTPSASIFSPALTSKLSLAPQETGASVVTAAAENTTEQSTETVAASTGITVPVRRPGSEIEQPQLALANTGTPSIAAQKAESIALKRCGQGRKQTNYQTRCEPGCCSSGRGIKTKKTNQKLLCFLV